jgi:AraC-like DNA-binding protein
MKLYLLDRSSYNNSSFTTKISEHPYFLKTWHYHPELELVVVLKSNGICFIGDHMETFKVGDVFLIGKDTPHMWLNNESYFKSDSKLVAKALTVHFSKCFLGTDFFETPEMIHLLELFDRSRLGIKFLNVDKPLIDEILQIQERAGYEKTISFLNVLNKLSKHKYFKQLASPGFVDSLQTTKNKTLDRVHSYIFKNFNKDIKLDDVAKIAHMNASAFSRFFKRVNRKTFSRYLSEIRIGYACKLLLEGKSNISSICYDAGFNNLSNFNRQFKIVMVCTPTEYISKHLKVDSIEKNLL